MASQAIKEYDDFAGQDGYIIVDGINDQTPGGKKLLSTIGGGGATYTIETLSGPYTISSDTVQVNLPDNHKIYEITNLPNNGETIQIIPPTVTEGEVIDVYINIELPETDTSEHTIYVSKLTRISDAFYGGCYSTVDSFAFIHLFYKYYTLQVYTDE